MPLILDRFIYLKTVSRKQILTSLFLWSMIGGIVFSIHPPHTDKQPKPNYDKRQLTSKNQKNNKAAAELLKKRVLGLRVDGYDSGQDLFFARSTDRPLTGKGGIGGVVSTANLLSIPSTDPHRVVKAFLKEFGELTGQSDEVLSHSNLLQDYTTKHNGVRTVVWEQSIEGIPVYQSRLIAHLTRDDELVNVSMGFVPTSTIDKIKASQPSLLDRLAVSAKKAIKIAASDIDIEISTSDLTVIPVVSKDAQRHKKFSSNLDLQESEAKLVWLPVTEIELRLAWEVLITPREGGEMYRVLVDGLTGQTWIRNNLTEYISDATYRIFSSDSPSPFSPGHLLPSSVQPPLTNRILVTTSVLSTNASPNGWINDGENETIGNNVEAHLDRDGDNIPDAGSRPQGSPFRVFDFSLDLSQEPTTYSNASVVNAFYWSNWLHDRLYDLGFTEEAGNFQDDNFGRGGLENDRLILDAQDGPFGNYARITIPPDGTSPRIELAFWLGPTPDRDGGLDVEVIIHEYTHGLSNRLVGGGAGITVLQSRGLGEGWSDFYSLALLSEATDDLNGNFPEFGYVASELSRLGNTLTNNYYFGIRRYPYSTDMTKNPVTFKDIDPNQADSHSGIPRNPVLSNTATQVHNMGEIWCSALWEVRANLVNKHGYGVGNELALQLVTDGMKLSPPNPNFLQARDAVLQADLVNNGSANHPELWAGFAKRGLGFSSSQPGSLIISNIVEAFDLPDDLRVTPYTGGLVANGPVGGPFTAVSKTYTLSNQGSNSLNWSATKTVSWVDLTSASGTLLPGGFADVTVSLNNTAYTLATGLYQDSLILSNTVSGVSQAFPITLRIANHFTELFDSSDNDLEFRTLTFTPNGSTNYYTSCLSFTKDFPSSTTNATQLVLSNDSSLEVTLSDSASIPFYGNNYTNFFVGSNGYITFETNDISKVESFASHFNQPRISALYYDLVPLGDGKVFWEQFANRVVITYQDVPAFPFVGKNNFQIEMFFDGVIRISYKDIDVTGGLAGLSDGEGVPPDFIESDLSSASFCNQTPHADLGINLLASHNSLTLGDTLTYEIAVTNIGPFAATSVIVTDTVPASVSYLGSTPSQGTCTNIFGTVACDLGSISIGSDATISLLVQPTESGIITNVATVTSAVFEQNTPNNQAEIVTLVNPPPPQLTVLPEELNFGATTINSMKTLEFFVINSGGSQLDGSASVQGGPFGNIIGSPYSIGVGQTGAVFMSFSPVIPGSYTNAVVFSSNGGVSTNAVMGVGLTPGELAVAPGSLAFGTLATGSMTQQVFVVSNVGETTVTNGTAVLENPLGAFGLLEGTSFELAGGASTNVVVEFAPVAEGAFTNAVVFGSANGGGLTNVISGTGAVVPVALFTATPTNGVAALDVTFTDSSSGTITNRYWDFGDGQTTNVTESVVVHRYEVAGTNSVELVVSGPVGVSTNRVDDLVLVLEPALLAVRPGFLDFGVIVFNETNSLPFAVINNGSVPMTGTAVVDGGPYGIISGSPYLVDPGQTGTVFVGFMPTVTGNYTNNVIFSSNGGGSTNALFGIAEEPRQNFLPITIDSATYEIVAGNTNSTIDPGEIIREVIILRNSGTGVVTNVTAEVSATLNGVVFNQSFSNYPNIPIGGTSTNQSLFEYRLEKSIPCGSEIIFDHVTMSGETLTSNVFTRVIGEGIVVGFTTNTYESANIPLDIPNFGSIESTNFVADIIGPVADVNVSLRVDHKRVGQLEVALEHPDGTVEVMLSDNNGGNSDNLGQGVCGFGETRTIFDDEASIPISSGSPPYLGSYQPDGSLNAFDGKFANGSWRLRVSDTVANTGGGKLLCWGLSISVPIMDYVCSPYNNPPVAINSGVTITNNLPSIITLNGSDIDGDTITFELLDPPIHGMVSAFDAVNGSVTYTPVYGFVGADSITFRVQDAEGAISGVATFDINVISQEDLDGDGMPDIWESIHGVDDPDKDDDNDGLKNLYEYLVNTNPQNSKSVLKVTSIIRNSSGSVTVVWKAVGGTRYRVQFSDVGTNGNYNAVFTDIVRTIEEEIAPGLIGISTIMSFTDDGSLTGSTPDNGGQRYYRVKAIQE